MDAYMFDTNIFNTILDEAFAVESISANMVLYVTRVQFDEISNTTKKERRARLLATFEEVPQAMTGTDTFLMNESLINQDSIGPAIIFNALLETLDSKKKKPNNPRDALIGETAINRRHTLVTDDGDFREAVIEHGGSAISWPEFKKRLHEIDSI
jgi:predicted nucleic acid-binding protein